MKTLIIYYSFEGSTEFIAKKIAEKTGADIMKLEPVNEIKSRGFSKYFWAGKQVMMKEKPELKALTTNPNDYDLIFIGTPIWAWTITPPLRTFLSQAKIQGKKVALFCSMGGQFGKAFKEMRANLENCEVLGEKAFIEPIKNQAKGEEELGKWLEELELGK